MNSATLIGILCKSCGKIVNINDKNHKCSIGQLQYSFEKSLIPTSISLKQNVPKSSKSNFMDGINNEELVSQPTENTTSDSLVDVRNKNNDSKFCHEFYIKLIKAVHQRQPLWDHRIPLSPCNEHKKQKLWDEIYDEFNGAFPRSTLKNKWKYLREKYVRDKRKPASGAGGEKRNWCLMSHLQFLNDIFMTNYKTTSNLNNSTSDETFSEQRTQTKKRPKTDTFEDAILNELQQSRPLPLPVEAEPNEDEAFGKYLTSIMKQLPKKKKMTLQAEFISKVISNVED